MRFIDLFFIVFVIAILGISGYLMYKNVPGKTIELKPLGGKSEESVQYTTSAQFYPNMRYSQKEISYYISDQCDSKKANEVRESFEILESNTVLEFYDVNKQDAQIKVLCSELAPEPENKGHFVAGEGGPTEVINTSLYSVILAGEISLYREDRCDTPHISLHEILHALGFGHNDNPRSILYPTLDCDQQIDNYLIEDINALYAQTGKADLKIENVNATKSGPYLSFTIEVLNQGLENVNKADLSIIVNGDVVNTFDLGDIEIGTKKILTVQNAKIPRSTEKVIFSADKEDKIDELYEGNNEITLALS